MNGDPLHELKQKYDQFFRDTSKGQILCLICPYTFSIDYSAYGLEPGRGLDTWDKLPELKLDRNRYWYQKILESFELYKKFWEGDYLLASYSHAGPGDMANAIRGNALFYDLYDEPDKVHTLMIRCHADDLESKIEDLKRGRVVIMLNVDSLEQVRDAMKFIRKNSII
jgi:hypothetical protein